ncbi:potassium channel family protein [Thalassomonas actiniarum]|uniref:Potassium channel protein n=1 Tax=Thalassomonas actiniarum TaxID=485447 RepID=A0AAE9YLS9_9GAMM|nr:potassium channel family protein [Thalassomonas actiniarum]WDD96689.1 potassium channel protein [Thalassomonas actiniarum]
MFLHQQVTNKYGFIVLLCSLVALLLLPSYWQGQHKQVVMALLLLVVMLSFLSLVARKRVEIILGTLLSLPVLYLNLHNLFAGGTQVSVLVYFLNVLFYLFIVFELLRHIISQKFVDFNLIAAIIVYLIIGLLWAFIYLILETQTPGAILGEHNTGVENMLSTLLYFSYVTMTTLGYGDISPHTELAGKWVVLEAIIGQFYIAILVARLVSLYGMKVPD